jgi:hypothetical protein
MATYKALLAHRNLLVFFFVFIPFKGKREKKNPAYITIVMTGEEPPGSVIDVDLP